LDEIELLAAAAENFASRLIDGLEADTARALSFVEQSLAMATALAPEIGYEKAAALAKEAYASGQTIRSVARTVVPEEELRQLLDPERQAGG
jgi:fumarate hydratase class II